MAIFSSEMPTVKHHIDELGFWDSCRNKQLVFQACGTCKTLRHPPTPMCAHCHSTHVVWREATGPAILFSYTVVHHPSHPAVRANLPYVVAVIEFPKMDGVRLITNIVDAPARLQIGTPMELLWDPVEDDMYLPRFRSKERHES